MDKIDLENVDILVHMGELSNDQQNDLNKKITNEINHNGTKKLLQLANNTKITNLYICLQQVCMDSQIKLWMKNLR